MNNSSHIIKIEKQFTICMNLIEKNILPIIVLSLGLFYSYYYLDLAYWLSIVNRKFDYTFP
jgi:hypothetical protein